eukprot:COSAG01_NODE_50511_length_362_cov_32.285171_1_plen_69_part_01
MGGASGCLLYVIAGRNAARSALGAGDARVMDWDSRQSPLGMGIMLESDSDIIPLIMPLLFRLFHLLLKK